jgi:glutaredoxin
MKYFRWLLVGVLALSLLGLAVEAKAQEKVELEFFFSTTCPYCAEEKLFLTKLNEKYPDLEIKSYVTSSASNRVIWEQRGKELGVQVGSVPFTVIGDKHWTGFEEETIGVQIEQAVKEVLGEEVIEKQEEGIIKVPLLGKINWKTMSLPVLTLVIAAVDGFNPCAMWTLLFLISLLLGLKDKRRMWLLGISFILASGVVYYFFLAAWLNAFLIIGVSKWIRMIIGLFAVGAGGWSFYQWWSNRDGGCITADSEKKKKIFEKLKEVVNDKRLLLAVLGIMGLAVAVNMVELACSAGLPAVYTQALALHNLPKVSYYLYLLLYIFIFMLDDLIIFVIAMLSFKAVGIESKYVNISRLIGGVVMLWIGYAMLFKPEWLSF